MAIDNQRQTPTSQRAVEMPLFAAIAECSPDFLAVLDETGVVTYISPASSVVTGYRPEEFIGKKLAEFVRPEEAALATRCFLSREPNVVRTCLRFRHKGGSSLLIDTRIKNCLDDPEIGGILIVTRDITDQHLVEESLRKVSRALNAFSAVSAALIQAKDESQLLDEVCRIMVESAGYRMAWVGFAETGDHKAVHPAAQFGYESGYLASANITWDESERGRGPTGSAIRKGVTQVNQSTLTNPHMQPWWQDALKRGYASSAAIPLKKGAATYGAFTIYAPEPDAFNSDELQLLEQLVAELSYGIMAFRALDKK